MRNLFDQAPCLYFSSADDGTLLEVNDRLCDVLQYLPEELIGKKIEIIFSVPTRIFQQTHFFPLLKMQGHAEEIYITLKKKDGEQVLVLINAERKIKGNTAVSMHVGIIVYNRKKFEEELIAARKSAEKALTENTDLIKAKQQLQNQTEELSRQISFVASQNNELQQFSRVVTHDMEEPLRKMALFSGMLLEGYEEKEQKKLLEKVKKVSEQMRTILSGLQQYVWLNDDRDILADVLQQASPQVNAVFAENGLKAIEYLSDKIGSSQLPCLIVLDLNMPMLDGRETFKKIKNELNLGSLPVIIFTSSHNPTDRNLFESLGIEFITKPDNIYNFNKVVVHMVDVCNGNC